ncbi:alpha-glucosidase [Lachnospiraceae bacterium XBB1006]|nr:alpha-glucosidase [Lachnospiraceae bacterium XBB1006]
MGELNKEALFADGTQDYCIATDKTPYTTVTLRLRTARNNCTQVFVHWNEQRIEMKKELHDDSFDFYIAEVTASNTECKYLFEVQGTDEFCFYQQNYASSTPEWKNAFRFVPGFETPAWMEGAVMYQIFTDRFYNGDPDNDVESREYYYNYAHSDRVEMWSRYPSFSHVGEFYGGDLAGVIKKLDYLEELGIEVIYFNPLFVSPSYHKYDTQDYDNIDPHFGVISVAEGRLLSALDTDNRNAERYISKVTRKENLDASNALFATLVEEAHKRGIRVIMDGVFNHCGSFHKWLDREKIYDGQPGYEKGAYGHADSPYRNYFLFRQTDGWPDNKSYDGWWGFDTLPKLSYETSIALEDEIMRIAAKWVSPPYNADGWRLDVAADLGTSESYNHAFWKRFRKVVKAANPDAVIIAEHYGNPSAWLGGDEWDSVMNYDAFMEPVSYFLTGMEKHSDEYHPELCGNLDYFKGAMEWHMKQFLKPSLYCSMNQLSNHDHSRFLTRTNHKVGRVATLGYKAAEEGVNPDVMAEAIFLQMTWPGAPTLYYGDEAGVCGFTDPDNRRTYPWGKENKTLLEVYKKAISLHREYSVLRHGSFRFLNGRTQLLSYARFNQTEQILVLINHTQSTLRDTICVWPAGVPKNTLLKQRIYYNKGKISEILVPYEVVDGYLDIAIPPNSVVILHGEHNAPYPFEEENKPPVTTEKESASSKEQPRTTGSRW